jgi:addiction module HigA family antidote
MPIHNPPHPGELMREVYLEPNGITGRQLATKLGVSPSTLNRVLQHTSGIRPEMALRLSKAPGRSPENCLAMQDNHDLWQARQTVNLDAVEHIDFRAA